MSADTDKLCRSIYVQLARIKSFEEFERAKINVQAIIGAENVAIVEKLLNDSEKDKK